MAATRRNILTSATDRDRYIQGIILLKEDDSGLTSDGLQIPRAAGVRNNGSRPTIFSSSGTPERWKK